MTGKPDVGASCCNYGIDATAAAIAPLGRKARRSADALGAHSTSRSTNLYKNKNNLLGRHFYIAAQRDIQRRKMFATRQFSRLRLPRSIPVFLSAPPPSRNFHASRVNSVQVNDAIPNVDLMETSPGNKVSIAKELKGKGLIIGIPAAFSPSCSNSHIPGYINHPGLKDAGQVFVVGVNDPFVMGAFAKSLDADNKSGVRRSGVSVSYV